MRIDESRAIPRWVARFFDPEDDYEMAAIVADFIGAASHLRSFIKMSAKRMGIPASERDDVVGEAFLEIAEELPGQQFAMLLDDIDASGQILDVLRDNRRGLAARRAIKRALKRFKFPTPTLTDIAPEP